MTKKSFLLVAALAVLVLGIACENNGGGGAPSSYTVTFMRNNDDSSGPEKVTVTVPAGEKIGDKLPNSQFPTVEEGWDAGYGVTGWHTSATGTGGKRLTTGTQIDEDWTVYAQWGYGQSQYVADDKLIVIAPEITQGGDMHGAYTGKPNANGSITWSSGGIRWMYPTEAEDYDYVEINYIGKDKDGKETGSIGNNLLKQYNTTTDYKPETGTSSPTFTLPTGELKFKVKYGGGGIAIQIYNGQERTMKFTKAVFTKGTRYPITFDLDFANAPQMPATFGVLNFEIGALPYPPAQKPGNVFDGWVNSANSQKVKESEIITGPLNLKATWKTAVPVSKIDVDFITASLVAKGTGSTITVPATGETPSDTNSYTFTYGSGKYNNSWAQFTLTIESGANLAAYKEVTFKYRSESGDTAYKPFVLLAAASLVTTGATSLPADPHADSSALRITDSVQVNTTEEWKDAKLTIDKAKAFSLQGTIEFCIYDHSDATKDGAKTSWSIKDLSFIPE